jgi:hypothetical protein
MVRHGLARAGVALCVLTLAAGSAAAQEARYALVVEGASGTEEYATLHRGWLDQLVARLSDDFAFDPARLHVLAESPGDGELPSTAESVRAVLERLSGDVEEGDLLFVMLIGHGGGQGADAKFNLVGRDLTVTEWSDLLAPIRGRIALVNATSSSFPYLEALAGPDRIVVTATNSYAQRLHTRFGGAFIDALGAAEADADKDNRVSLLEAFTHASRLVAQHYEQAGNMATETAVLDDDGDGRGRLADAEDAADGTVAGLTFLAPRALPASSDPEVQQLIQRQADLTAEVDDLRRRRRSMDAEAFDREFERLIVELALVSREVRRRTGG